MPGAGKSTVGRLLAKRLGRRFLDTDEVIETAEGMRLSELIARHGAAGFQAIEGRALRRAYQLSADCPRGSVVATGGSVVYCSAAMEELQRNCLIIFLDVDLETLVERVGNLDQRGVLRPAGQTLDQLFAERHTLYRRYAHIALRTGRFAPPVACAHIETQLAGRRLAASRQP